MSTCIHATDTEHAQTLEAKRQAAAYVRAFLAGARPLRGNCYCGNESFHAGRGFIERLALALDTDDDALQPTATQCVDILEFLAAIEPHSSKHCHGCAGGAEQCGLNIVLRHVQERLCQAIEAKGHQGGAA